MRTANPVELKPFSRSLEENGLSLRRSRLKIVQINVGRLCNLTCTHCHVNAGPARKEIMTGETVDRILDWYGKHPVETVDLTGGAPEMMPDFRRLVDGVRAINPSAKIIDRCNLVILNEPGYEWLGEFLRSRRIEIVASMPCYSPDNVDAQRGNGVFDRSIAALQLLNELGYASGDGKLALNLVYNPGGAWLPPEQSSLEADYKRELEAHFGIRFDRLFALANLPIARFASYLKRQGEYESYMQLLLESFNPATVDRLMCRDTLSVSWTGEIFDCDFNQMLGMNLGGRGASLKLWDVTLADLEKQPIATGNHCYGCTAGSGASCGGSLV